MNEKLVINVLELARYYPSGDNCQPFRFRYSTKNKQLLVDYIASEASHTFAYDEFTFVITLGGLLEYLRNAFAIFDTQIEISLNLDNFDVNRNHDAICSIETSETSSITLPTVSKEILKQRVTDRRPYQSAESISINVDDINKTLNFSLCALHVNASPEILDFFALCDSMVWQSKQLLKDINSSISFSAAPASKGLPWRNLGIKKAETYPLRLLQKYHGLYSLFKKLGAGKAMQRSQRKLWDSSKSFLVFSYHSGLSLSQKTLANMELMNAILILKEQGYHFQPSTMSTDILNVSVKPNCNLQTAADLDLAPINSDIEQIRSQLKLENKEVNWILRCGKPTKAFPDNARTSRSSVAELLQIED